MTLKIEFKFFSVAFHLVSNSFQIALLYTYFTIITHNRLNGSEQYTAHMVTILYTSRTCTYTSLHCLLKYTWSIRTTLTQSMIIGITRST